MIVVADASPLNYLIQIQCERLLHSLYGHVLVPAAVMDELRHPAAPKAVSAWVKSIPDWIEVRAVRARQDLALESLDAGEREAIQLAEDQRVDLLLIDEKRGREMAKRRGIGTMGTLGILLAAGREKLVDPEVAFERLTGTTSFRSSASLRADFLRLCRDHPDTFDRVD